jgi:hypothetical protein
LKITDRNVASRMEIPKTTLQEDIFGLLNFIEGI